MVGLPQSARAGRALTGPARGFTLTELLVTVAIFAILATLAAPSYRDFVRNQRVKTASFELVSSLILARSEAITRDTTVIMAPSSGTSDWAPGWEVKAGATLLRKQEAMPDVSITGPTSISYNGTGRLSAALASGIELSASGTGITSRCITVDLSGRPVSKAEPCA
jgi:type IV fimbrial biogenesis protein FimT